MITALIVDDERLARRELRRLLRAHPETEVIGEAAGAEEAVSLARKHDPDLMFLDVDMPGRDGFETLAELSRPPAVIFTTAYEHFALRAFEVDALDYLLKPIEPERLAAALARFQRSEAATEPDEGRLTEQDRVFVKDGDRCWFVRLGDVGLLESEGNYTRLYFGEDRPLIYRSLAYLETRLDSKAFFRVNRKHMINLKWVERLEPATHGGIRVALRGGRVLDMSRRQAQKFRESLSL